jgi:four helix bundle protein
MDDGPWFTVRSWYNRNQSINSLLDNLAGNPIMPYKFESLDIWQMSLDYLDLVYKIANNLPDTEKFNLRIQLVKAGTSVSLNIAEGSTGQTDTEQSRFLRIALRSLIETVACQRIIQRRGYLQFSGDLEKAYDCSQSLAKKIQAMRRYLGRVRDDEAAYGNKSPFDVTDDER